MSIATWEQGVEHKAPRLGFPAYIVSLAFHIGVVALIIVALMRPGGGGSGSAGPAQPHGIGTFVSVSTVAPPASVAPPPRPAAKMSVARDKVPETSTAGQTAAANQGGGGGIGSGTGPMRLGSGEGLGVLRKVQPIYPRIMQMARTPGTVVL